MNIIVSSLYYYDHMTYVFLTLKLELKKKREISPPPFRTN